MSKERTNYGGVKAAQPEDYTLMSDWILQYHGAEDAWWAKPFVIITLTIIFSVMDALVLYTVLDKAMLQSKEMGVIMALGIAVVLNIIPLVVAKFIHQAIYKTKRLSLLLAILSICAFLFLFGGTVYLRFAYSDMYGSSSASQLVNTVSNEQDSSKNNSDSSEKGIAVVILLCLEPLVTSIVNFALAYLSDDELRKKIKELELREVELHEATSDLEAALATMNYDIQLEMELDEIALQTAKDEIDARCNILKAIARSILAEHLANASATSKLGCEMLQNNNFINESTALSSPIV